MTRSVRTIISAVALGASSVAADAQSTKGIFVGIQYAGSSLNVKSAAENLEFGNGFGVHAGLGISDTWSVLANFDRSVLTGSTSNADVTLTQYDALLRMNVLPGAGSPIRVFLTAGATARSVDAGREFEQISPTAGAGAHLFVTPKIAINGTALWTFGKLTQADQLTAGQNGQFESTQTRVQAGVSLYLFGK